MNNELLYNALNMEKIISLTIHLLLMQEIYEPITVMVKKIVIDFIQRV